VEVDNNLLARQLALAFSHPGVEKELDLVAYQKEQLRDLFYDYQKTLAELAQRFARMKQEDRSQLVGELVEKVDAELDKVLLPQQRKRLRQISLQSVVPANNQGLAPFYAVLGNASYCEALGISVETASQLQAKLREENDKFRAEVDRLRAASLERVLDTLTSAEREALTEGLGTAFDFGGYELGRGGVFRNADDK
jgi:DNA-directed RNA polymerase subunit F